jgi:hypothetical protein
MSNGRRMNCKGFGRDHSLSDQGAILHVPRGTAEKHDKPQSGKTVSQLRFELSTCQVKVQSITTTTAGSEF